ncbi:NAD(P)-dependent oxidoreductase [Bradyrhizobium sp. 31Argb]
MLRLDSISRAISAMARVRTDRRSSAAIVATASPSTPSPQPAKPARPRLVGVVGLGRMGRAFAENLGAAGYPIIVWDASQAQIDAVVRPGIIAAANLADLADCDVVITSLPDDDALASVATGPQGLLDMLATGAIHISMSTVSPPLSRHLAAAHAARSQNYVSAPILGNPDMAHTGDVFILAAGPHAAIDSVRPLLEVLGQRLFVIGEEAAAANLMKLAANVLTALTMQGVAEVLALLRKGGIDHRIGFDILTNSLFDSRVHRTYGGKIANERYCPPGMPAPLAVKDLRLALAEAERHSAPMPAASLVHDRLVAMVAHGWTNLDWSALGLLAAQDAGLPDIIPAESGTAAPTTEQAAIHTDKTSALSVTPIDHVYPPSTTGKRSTDAGKASMLATPLAELTHNGSDPSRLISPTSRSR